MGGWADARINDFIKQAGLIRGMNTPGKWLAELGEISGYNEVSRGFVDLLKLV